MTIREGETLTYNIRLSEQPAADGWWLRIHVNGVVYIDGNHDNSEGIGIRWVPSVGWQFNREEGKEDSDPTQWRSVRITAFQDGDAEDEFVTITHEVWDEDSNCPPSLHGVAPVEVQVTDDETASTGVALSVNPMTVREGAAGTTVTVRAALNGAARLGSTPVKVAVGKTGDSATEGTDYETVDDLTVTIPAGLTSATERFTLTPTNDVVVESDKTITVSGTTAASGITTVNPATLTIIDDDVPPDTIELRVSPSSVPENAGETDIMVTAAFPPGSATLSTPTVVNVTLSAATAQTADFTPVQPFNVTIPASAGSGTATFQFTPNDDTSMEGSETITVSGTTAASGITTVNSATLTIIDNDTPNNPPMGQPKITGTARVSQVLTAVTTDIQDADGLGDFAYQWKADGTDIAGAMDSSYTLTNDELGKRITVTVSFTDGIGTEEAVTSQPTDAVRDAVTTRSPPPPTGQPELTVAFDRASYNTTEGGDPVTLRVTLNRTSSQDLTIPITVMPQGATEADDYTVSGLTDGALSFSPRDLSKTFMIVATEDTDSDDETIELGFGTLPEGVSKGAVAAATLTIVDDDTPNNPPTGQPRLTVAFDRASYNTTEGGDPVTLRVTLNRTSSQDLTIPITVMPQGATEADDYTVSGLTDGALSFSPRDLFKTFMIVATEDTDSDDETIELGFGTLPEGVSKGAVATASLTIVDAGPPELTVAFDRASYNTTEGGDPVTLRVTLNRTSSQDLTIPITVMPQGATEADDYTVSGLTDGALSFSPRDLSKTFMIVATEDTDSDDETIELGFGTLPEGVSKGAVAAATLTIVDDDTPNNPPTGQPRLTVAFDRASYNTTEGGDPVTLRVTLNRTSSQDLTIPITVMPQGATEADDYTVSGLTDGALSFSPRDLFKTFMIVATEDTDSDDETIELGFGTLPEGVSKGAVATASLTIVDAGPPELTVAFDRASYNTTEGGDPVTLRVTLNRTSSQDLAIPITVMPQGATEADDYTVSGLTDGALSFSPRDLSKTFMIVANEDTDSDDETIELGFGALPEGVSKGEMATATLTIVDAGPLELTVSFARAEYTIAEGGEPSSINVNISPAADRQVEVPLVVMPQGGATSQDYDGVPTSIVFEVSATVVTFQVTAPADQEDDPGKSIILGFGDLPEAVSEGNPSETTVKFTQQRSAEQFSAPMKILLAVTARSVADSAQTAIQSRFQRKRQLMRNRQSARGPNTGESLSAGQAGRSGSGLGKTGALNHMPEVDRFGFAPSRLAVDAGPSMGSTRSGSLHNSLAPDYGIATDQAAYGYDTLQRTSTADPSLGAFQFAGIRARQPILSQASFNLQMGESAGGNDGNGSVVLWVQGDLQDFNGNITRGGMDYRGVMGAVHVGLDLYNSEQMLVGFSFMRSFARINYNADGVHGMFRNGMNTAHPYLYWQPNERFSAWGIGGLGRGEVDVNGPDRAHDLTSDFRMFSGGMRSVLAKRGNTEVGVVVDSFTARLGTSASKDIERVSGQVSRTRMMLEMVHDKPLEAGRSLSIKAEFGHRLDAGDADRGSGAEAGFRLGYLDTASGLDIAWHGRMLLVRESDYRDFGVGVQVSWDPGEKRRGLQLSMMSSRGHDGGGRTTLWNNSALVTRPMGSGYMPNASQTSTSSEVAYGMDIFGKRGLLTSYSRLQLAGCGRDLRVGTELSLLSRGLPAQPAKVQLEGIRRETPNRMIDLGMMLGISIPF